MKTAMIKTALWPYFLSVALSLRVSTSCTVRSNLQYMSSSGYAGSNGAAASSSKRLYSGVSGGDEFDNFSPSNSPSNSVAPKFPYDGERGFRTIMADKSFYVDKTSYIRTLETSAKYLRIWRPRRFGKTLVCDMLAEYYDAANSADQLRAMFGETDIVRKRLTTTEMGKYLVLRLSFSDVAPDKDTKRNFCDYINGAVQAFSEKYVKAGLLDGPIDVDPEDHLYSLNRLFSKVELSGRKIYLIVDEWDSFVSRLLLSVDRSKPDLGLEEYKKVVSGLSGAESMLWNWGNVIKEGTIRAIARAFFTGVVPLSDGLSSLNMVMDLTHDREVSGLFGLTAADVSRGLSMIDGLTPDLHSKHLEHMRALYGGYRFKRTQTTEPLFNTQYVLQYLDQLDRSRSPPESLNDPAVSGSTTDNVAEYVIANYKAYAPFTSLRIFAVGNLTPNETETFDPEEVTYLKSKALFDEATVSASLRSLAYFHGFLTYKFDEESNSFLASPNVIMQKVFIRALLPGMPEKWMKQMEATISSAEPDTTEFQRIAALGVAEVVEAGGKEAGDKLAQSLAKLTERL